MVWTFSEAEAYLNDTAPPGKSVYGLGRIRHLLELLGHPERSFPSVTVVGTNGKGSVLAFLDALSRAHGLKVVCHIKPHLESVTERIRIDGMDSTPKEFASALWEVRQAIDGGWSREDRPTYFELLFAAALFAAGSAEAELALLEAGLGGRLDAVNAVDARLVVLTSVDLDHTELLGDSLESITREKLDVVRPGAALVCQTNPPAVMEAVHEYAAKNEVRLLEAADNARFELAGNGTLTYESTALGRLENVGIGIGGPFRALNAGLALVALEVMARETMLELFPQGLEEEAIRLGLGLARLPGRWEKICPADAATCVILDGAHNPSGLGRVLEEFAKITDGSGTIVFGLKATKPVGEIMPKVLRAADRVVFVPVPDVQCHPPQELARLAREELDKGEGFSQIQISCADAISESLELALTATPENGSILVTGSLYLVGAARAALGQRALIPQDSMRV